jgi:DNA mismatch repair protein MSH4
MTHDTTAIKGGRHPMLDGLHPGDVVSNDTLLCPFHSFLLITGPNMSGKSTFLRQLVLLTIMAHMGMFVPVENAMIRLTDAIFTRIGSDDDMESNASTFFVEMREMGYALSALTAHSLVIVDELGRGSSTMDGLSITVAICEMLAQMSVFVAMVTHFPQLVDYLASMPNVAIMSLSVEESDERLSYSYKINPGNCMIQDYGLKMAKQSGLSERVMDVACHASAVIKRIQGSDSRLVSVRKVLEKRKLVRQTAEKIRNMLNGSKLSREHLEMMLIGMRDEFQAQLDAMN